MKQKSPSKTLKQNKIKNNHLKVKSHSKNPNLPQRSVPSRHIFLTPIAQPPRLPLVAHLDAGEELPGAGAAERREDDQRAAQRAPGALDRGGIALAAVPKCVGD